MGLYMLRYRLAVELDLDLSDIEDESDEHELHVIVTQDWDVAKVPVEIIKVRAIFAVEEWCEAQNKLYYEAERI